MSKVNIKNIKPNGKYKHGKYVPYNTEKYIGDINNIVYRSSWEKRFCAYCDVNPNIIKWSSEPIIIDYWSPIDEKMHEYNVDFYIKVKKEDGVLQDWFVEIKPEIQYSLSSKPVLTGNITEKKVKQYNEKMKIWITNRAKFEAATRFAEDRGYKFGAINENYNYR